MKSVLKNSLFLAANGVVPMALAPGDIAGVDEAFTWFDSFFILIKDKLSTVAFSLAAVALLVMLILWLVTTNEKKTDSYKKKFFTVLIIIVVIAAISGIIAIAKNIGADLNTTIGGT